MKFIPLKNKRLIKLLNDVTDGFFERDYVVKSLPKIKANKEIVHTHLNAFGPCSDEYLFEALKLDVKDFGFPRVACGSGMGRYYADVNTESFQEIQKQSVKIGKHLGTPVSALTMLYPDNGFIGWHHNGNAPGYNILITHSQDGNGQFRYYDRKSNNVVDMPDVVGWSVKVGYYPNEKTEIDRVYWHSAETKKARISLAWVINHRPMWENMIEEITDGEVGPEVLHQDQMTA